MLRNKLMFLMLALCSSLSIAAYAESGTNNSVVILLCDTGIHSGSEKEDNSVYQLINIDPPDFNAVDVNLGDDCAISIAKLNHYGWRIDKAEFDDNIIRLQQDNNLKHADPCDEEDLKLRRCFFETLGVTLKK